MQRPIELGITNPEQHTLLLHFKHQEIRVAAFNPSVENSLIFTSITIDSNTANWLKTVENAVYDNPELLQDFERVKIIVDSDQFIITPAELDDEPKQKSMFRAFFPNFDGDVLVMPQDNVPFNVIFGVQRGLTAFLRRTFNNPPIVSDIFTFAKFYLNQDTNAEKARLHANFDGNTLYIVVIKVGKLMFANSYHPRDDEEAFYYISNVWKWQELDQLNDELILSGNKSMRDIITPKLREYYAHVLPEMLPVKALKLSNDANLVPRELIMLALCE